MLEIVHDMAPEAQLYFATAGRSPAQMADNIIGLAEAGCKVIVDDIGWLNESPFHDSAPVTDAINTVGVRDVVYISAAGNDGNKQDGQTSVWEGPFQAAADDALVHQFGSEGRIAVAAERAPLAIALWWSDPLRGSSNDYDLFLVDTDGRVVAQSSDRQDGGPSDEPVEVLINLGGLDWQRRSFSIRVRKRSASMADRHLRVSLFGCPQCILQGGTTGHIFGHAAAEHGLGIAAVRALPDGRTFADASQSLRPESFSSDGPRLLFYGGDGVTPLTNDLVNGGHARQQPVFTAANGVTSVTPGFTPFFGTSAAAPHVAGLVALLRSAQPDGFVNGTTLVQLLRKHTIAVGPATAGQYDKTVGYGIPDIAPLIPIVRDCGEGRYVDVASEICRVCPESEEATNVTATPGSIGVEACFFERVYSSASRRHSVASWVQTLCAMLTIAAFTLDCFF